MNESKYKLGLQSLSIGNTSMRVLFIRFLVLLICSPLALAQHEMHNMAPALDVQTMPENDQVLELAPTSVMLHFKNDVRLVKLALKDSKRGYIDIDFRYDSAKNMHFMHSLPKLEESQYYSVQWAILDNREQLIKGSFSFSFGEGARPPSYYLDLIKHPQHIMAPDYRLF